MPGKKNANKQKGGAKNQKVVAKKAPVSKKQTGGKKAVKAAKVSKVAKAALKKVAKKGGKKKVVEPVEDVVQDGGEVKVAKKQRYFRLLVDNEAKGRFSGVKPKQAASKALTSLLRARTDDGLDTAGEHHYTMVECTRGCSNKKYRYVGERVALNDPVTVTLGDKKIVYRHNNVVRKDKTEAEAN